MFVHNAVRTSNLINLISVGSVRVQFRLLLNSVIAMFVQGRVNKKVI
jgi:hypothetical protein